MGSDETRDEIIEHEVEGSESVEEKAPQVDSPHTVAYMQLMSDPDIRKVIEAKVGGKSVEIRTPESQAEEEETFNDPTPELDKVLDSLSPDDPARKAVEKVVEVAKTALTSRETQLKKLGDRLSQVETVTRSTQAKEINTQVSNAREKFKDFSDYSRSMLELSNQLPGLNVEELYLLAKSRAGKLKLQEGSTYSEKPTSQPRRESVRKARKEPLPTGRKGFDRLLSEALQNLEFPD